MRRLLPACAVLALSPLHAQDIGAFLDHRNYFFVFDHGVITQLETLPPRAFVAGGNYLAYAASNGDLKIHRDGRTTTIDQNIATLPAITDHYLGYVSAGVMKVFDGDSLRVLCRSTGGSVVEDSVAGFYDEVQRTLNLHYRGTTVQVEDALMENPVQTWKAGDNTIAWISRSTREFKVFHRGEVQVLASLVTDLPFSAGLDVVAFQDPVDKGLKAFFKGDVIDVEPIMPERILMGKGLFAYLDPSGALKVFQNGTTHTALDFTPDEFFVDDSLVVIHDKDRLKVFHDGNTTTVLGYYPKLWRASWGTLAWLDVDGSVKAWRKGTTFTVMQKEPVRDFSLDRGLITITLTAGARKVWWKGKLYMP